MTKYCKAPNVYVPLIDLLTQVGNTVLDLEDIHQLLAKGAGDGTIFEVGYIC